MKCPHCQANISTYVQEEINQRYPSEKPKKICVQCMSCDNDLYVHLCWSFTVKRIETLESRVYLG